MQPPKRHTASKALNLKTRLSAQPGTGGPFSLSGTSAAIIPWSCSAGRPTATCWPALTMKTAWDRPLSPLPFARVTVSLTKPWHIPADCGADIIHALCAQVEETLNQMMYKADADAGYLKKWPEVYGSTLDPRDSRERAQ